MALHDPDANLSGFTVSSEPVVVDPVKTEPVKEEAKPEATTTEPVKTDAVKAEVKVEDADLLKILNERGISLSSLDDVKTTFSEREALKAERENLTKKVAELEKKPLEFPNDKAKALYEFAVKYPGTELSAAKNFLNLVELDLTKADAKTKLFEHFALENPKLPRDKAKVIFDAQYEKDYGDGNFEGNPLLEFQHDKAVSQADNAIAQAVKAYHEAKEPEHNAGPSQEDIDRISKALELSVKDYKEASVTLSEYQTKIGETIPQGSLKVALSPEEVATVKDYMANPDKILNEILLKDNGGALDYNAYRDAITALLFPSKFYAQVHAQGIEQGILAAINQAKNSQRDNPNNSSKDAPVAKTWGQAIDESRAKN